MSLFLLTLSSLSLATDLVVLADEVRPVSSPAFADGAILIEDGRITAVGPAAELAVPSDVRTLRAKIATPGLIDGLSVAGLSGAMNQSTDQDHRESSQASNPHIRALDAYNAWDTLVGWLREHGITTIVTGPSPGNVIAGRSVLTSTAAGPTDEVVRVPDSAVVFTLGERSKFASGRAGGPTSRMGSAATIRQALASAREYAEGRRLRPADRPPVDLGQEALAAVLRRELPAAIVAHRADDILTALRIGAEFDLDLVLVGASEAYLVRDAIRERDVPVLVGPVMVRSGSASETSNSTFENAALLADAGISIGFTSGYEGYVPKVRVVLWEAAIAATNGLGPDRTLHALTLGPATIWGQEGDIGSLEIGKRADIALFDGDPFEYTSHVCGVVIGGEVVSETCR